MKWQDRLAKSRGEIPEKGPGDSLTKPTKPPEGPESGGDKTDKTPFVTFGSDRGGTFPENSGGGQLRQLRERLARIADGAGLSVGIVARLGGPDLDACVGCTDSELNAFLLALDASVAMRAGRVPTIFTVASECPGCGPVWLPEPLHPAALSCPWCIHRKAGRAVPRPA